MIAVPKLVLFVLVAFAVWYAVRWFNRAPPKVARRNSGQTARPRATIEDLVACGACGAYVAASARGCGKAGCPRPA